MRKQIFYIDCDGVLSDFVGGVLDLVLEECDVVIEREHVVDYSLVRNLPELLQQKGLPVSSANRIGARVATRVMQHGFCRNMKPLPGSKEAILRLRELGRVVIATTPYLGATHWMEERAGWVAHHHPGLEVVHIRDKSLLAGDLLLDDQPKQVRAWQDRWCPRQSLRTTPALLWDTPQNRDDSTQDLRRVRGWNEVIELIEASSRSPASS